MTTRDEILAEANGDTDRALDLACWYYEHAMTFIPVGYIRGDTSQLYRDRVRREPKAPLPPPVLLPSEDSPNG